MLVENPYASPKSDTFAQAEKSPPQKLGLLALISKWFRILLYCAVAASLIATLIMLAGQLGGSLELLFDLRPRHVGRMIVDGPLSFGAIALSILIVTELVRNFHK